MAVIDKKERCQVEGCGNLGDVHKKFVYQNGDVRVYRRNLCCTHRKKKYEIVRWNEPNSAKESGEFNECSRCGWEGPCDVHRIKPGSLGGKYSKTNVASLCPNCHRLFHRGMIEYLGYKVDSSNGW
jgi:hypothetical protein